ncbi:HD domain-containing protein [Aquibacillus sp. 3ASR75-11]|uniref:HD domain-containing protein n=1 Tax=Terrihalobacillus insolitus TaxID=2950438 RepID=A0A9X3WVB8_9BACI|nr:HD domain-containing protein [Terrihalobacillus insolitus]MDC3424741.1 HD domain-containing protein [Terrihalobacillus insolitus]
MNNHAIINQTEQYVYGVFQHDITGHDFYHMRRVARMAKLIAESEGGDPFVTEMAGWVHDIGDKKLFEDPKEAHKNLFRFLNEIGVGNDQIEQISLAIKDVSFSKGGIPTTLEGRMVQDADRLDAIGAIGIARTFAYGGANGQIIYDPENQQTSIQHFYDKLLQLKWMMHTKTAKNIAEKRHQYLEDYISRFFEEWGFE